MVCQVDISSLVIIRGSFALEKILSYPYRSSQPKPTQPNATAPVVLPITQMLHSGNYISKTPDWWQPEGPEHYCILTLRYFMWQNNALALNLLLRDGWGPCMVWVNTNQQLPFTATHQAATRSLKLYWASRNDWLHWLWFSWNSTNGQSQIYSWFSWHLSKSIHSSINE